MPTLVNNKEESESMRDTEETIGMSGRAWLTENLGCRFGYDETPFSGGDLASQLTLPQCAPERVLADNPEAMNDESLSRTLTEDEVAEHLSSKQPPSQDIHTTTLRNGAGNISSDQTSSFAAPPPPALYHENVSRMYERKMGSNELLYNSKYRSFVDNRIHLYRSQRPGQLREYRSMNDVEKEAEHQRVIALLQRLGIAGNNVDKENVLHVPHHADCSVVFQSHANNHFTSGTVALLDETEKSDANSSWARRQDKSPSRYEESMVLLSSSETTELPAAENDLFSPMASRQDDVNNMSVELLSPSAPTPKNALHEGMHPPDANCSPVESPETVRRERKRLASTSGKRGSDLVRARLSTHRSLQDDMKDTCTIIQREPSCSSPTCTLADSIGRLSLLDDANLFRSSQSPIVPRLSHSPMRDGAYSSSNDFPAPDISIGEDDTFAVASESSRPVYGNDSLIETAMLPDKRVRWDFDGRLTKEAPTDVRVVAGKSLLWPKLTTELRRREAPPTQTYPDPISYYPDKVQRRLGRLYRWLQQLQRHPTNDEDDSRAVAVVLSLNEQMIRDLILKLHMDFPLRDHFDELSTKDGVLCGHTLIVARAKEDLEIWGRSFREGSALSVLNHAAMPLSERKSPSTASKSVQFDIVLTTYDALKSCDVTVTLTKAGFAENTQNGPSDGWYTSASQSTESVEQKKQLSVLHRVKWFRLILVDTMGRKSYLAKAGTTRVQAVRALNSASRLALFVKSDDSEVTGIEALLKSDRSAAEAINSVLRAEANGMAEEALRAITVDFEDKSTMLKMSMK